MAKTVLSDCWELEEWVPLSSSAKIKISLFSTPNRPKDPKVSLRVYHLFPMSQDVSPYGDGFFPQVGKGFYVSPERLRELARALLKVRRQIVSARNGGQDL